MKNPITKVKPGSTIAGSLWVKLRKMWALKSNKCTVVEALRVPTSEYGNKTPHVIRPSRPGMSIGL